MFPWLESFNEKDMPTRPLRASPSVHSCEIIFGETTTISKTIAPFEQSVEANEQSVEANEQSVEANEQNLSRMYYST
jgi:hypothetical protein